MVVTRQFEHVETLDGVQFDRRQCMALLCRNKRWTFRSRLTGFVLCRRGEDKLCKVLWWDVS